MRADLNHGTTGTGGPGGPRGPQGRGRSCSGSKAIPIRHPPKAGVPSRGTPMGISSTPSSESDWTDFSSVSSRRGSSLNSRNSNSSRRQRHSRRNSKRVAWRCLRSISSFGDSSDLSSSNISAAAASAAVEEAVTVLDTLPLPTEAAVAAIAAGGETDRESLWGDVEENSWGFDFEPLIPDAEAEIEMDVVAELGIARELHDVLGRGGFAFAAVAAEMLRTTNVRNWALYFALRAELMALLSEHRDAWIAAVAAQRMLQDSNTNGDSSSNSSMLHRLADIRSLCLLHFAHGSLKAENNT